MEAPSGRRVEFGLTVFSTDESADPSQLAIAAEQAGFALLLFPDHTHIPVERRSPYPGGGEMPAFYRRTHDPLVACSWALAATRRLRVGIGVCLVPARDPIILAKQVASVDHLSGGRFVLGVGAGWNAEEIADHGVEPARRWDVMRERVLAMQAIWAGDEAEFHGAHVDFGPMWSWPKPAQRPRPTIMVGGHGDGVIDRVVEYGDEWLVMPSPGRPALRDRIRLLHERASAAGRRRPAVSCQLYGAIRSELVDKLADSGVGRIDLSVAHGSAEQMIDEIGRLGETIAALG
jgi:probable F420-dependent oxidoreductase